MVQKVYRGPRVWRVYRFVEFRGLTGFIELRGFIGYRGFVVFVRFVEGLTKGFISFSRADWVNRVSEGSGDGFRV